MSGWPKGEAAVCKTVHASSILALDSNKGKSGAARLPFFIFTCMLLLNIFNNHPIYEKDSKLSRKS